jgi:hypothetical protein
MYHAGSLCHTGSVSTARYDEGLPIRLMAVRIGCFIIDIRKSKASLHLVNSWDGERAGEQNTW